MLNCTSKSDEVFLIANINEHGKVINFPMGGGSSTKPSIKAHDNLKSAKRAQRFFKGSVIVKATSFEIVEGANT
ncbi:hypothetical protein CW357_00960 [Rummeliibacillus sp. TYF005]|uniref:hypothetical protein n=1 Tax=Rummeliibacillus sp. TYF005 TaxID=2058214 RepID=UPI000F548B3B|nr:hypothetical protein [Rummeliibacillus sp. TYF005]RPJ97267.1 hypothetical protein CW357_00960 [Rummeliibacillus sp. TYF005]